MELIRDLLDKAVVDDNGREIGRVDSVLIDVRPGEAPRLTALELGPEVLAHRLHPILGRVVTALEYAFGLSEGRPVRISFSDVLEIDDQVKVDLPVGKIAAAVIERRLRRWIGFIPGAS